MKAQVIGGIVWCIAESDGVTCYVPWFRTDARYEGWTLTESMIKAAKKLFCAKPEAQVSQ